MIKNVKLKKFLVSGVFPIFSLFNKLVPKKQDMIFIYCANGDLNDNSKALYEYLIENEYNKKYKIICGVGNVSEFENNKPENVFFVSGSKNIFTYMKSGHTFYSMGKIPIKPTKKQKVINMWHGAPLKTIGKLSNINNGKEFFFTYVCATSETYKPIMAKAFGCPLENVVICGQPKTDKVFIPKEVSDNKKIVWAPTFRQSDFLGYNDSKETDVLPLFKQDEWEELNEFLKANKVEVLVKLHPLQNANGMTKTTLSNMTIYTDKAFREEKLDLFACMSQSDGLISDYSGVFIDYLMLNRPICFALPDFEEYGNTRGFVFDNPMDYMPGIKATTKEDIYTFIKHISLGEDDGFKADREKVGKSFNLYTDGQNCKRTLEIAGVVK